MFAGIVRGSFGMPDIHSGYGFAIGNVAAFDMDDPQAVVSPGGVGFDINWYAFYVGTRYRAAYDSLVFSYSYSPLDAACPRSV